MVAGLVRMDDVLLQVDRLDSEVVLDLILVGKEVVMAVGIDNLPVVDYLGILVVDFLGILGIGSHVEIEDFDSFVLNNVIARVCFLLPVSERLVLHHFQFAPLHLD